MVTQTGSLVTAVVLCHLILLSQSKTSLKTFSVIKKAFKDDALTRAHVLWWAVSPRMNGKPVKA